MNGAPLGWLSRPDELVFAFVALDEGGVDRRREGRVVEFEREVLGAGLSSGPAPAGAELDTVGGDAIVGGLVAVAVAGLDGGLDVEGEGLGEARKGTKMSLGLDQLVAECAAKRDIAVDVGTQRGSLPPQGCAISNRRLMSTLA